MISKLMKTGMCYLWKPKAMIMNLQYQNDNFISSVFISLLSAGEVVEQLDGLTRVMYKCYSPDRIC